MSLIEIVEGEDTSAVTVTSAVTFAQSIRKQPITCAEVPGFVVYGSSTRASPRCGAPRSSRDCRSSCSTRASAPRASFRSGPTMLVNLLGLDTVLHVAEHLVESYGDERFYVPSGMQKLVSERRLGAKTGGDGFYDSSGRVQRAG